MIVRRAIVVVVCSALPVAALATPALSPPFLPLMFQEPDSSIIILTSGLDVIGWRSDYRIQGGDANRFAVTRTVGIRRRDIERIGSEWTYEEDVMLRGERPLNPLVNLRGWVDANLYSDEFQNQMHWVQQGAGVALTPVPWVELYPAVGAQEDFRQGHRDRGTLLTSHVMLVPPSWGEGSFSWGVEELGPRQNRDLDADYHVRGDFQEDTFDEFQISYQEQDRAYYIAAGEDIARRKQNDRSVRNLIGYPLGRGNSLTVTTSARDAKVDISSGNSLSRHREVETAVQLALRTVRDSYTGQVLYEWNAQNQEFDQDRINGTHQAIRAIGSLQLTDADVITYNGSILKNRFDTPDTLNFDDRDEWSAHMSVTYTHPINDYLIFSQEAATYLDHLVYIFAQRSDNNYWRRVFRLVSTLTSTPFPDVVNRNSFLITTTYRDYDFDTEENPKSDVYRRYSAVDSLDAPIWRHLGCLVIYRLDLEDRGLLDWSDWIQQISEEYRTNQFQAAISYISPLGWMISAGWNESLRLGWRYISTSVEHRSKARFEEIRTSGPTLACHWWGFDRLEIQVSGQLQNIRDRVRGNQTLVFADVNLRWNF
jgi:hypothetical protein